MKVCVTFKTGAAFHFQKFTLKGVTSVTVFISLKLAVFKSFCFIFVGKMSR